MAGARIQLKRATAASWASNNPVLYAGEIGLETDTNKFKIGDGTTAFNSLSYFNGNLTGSSLNDLADVTIVSASNGDFLRWNGSAWINDAVNLSTDTVGNYMVDVAGGTGVTISHTPGEGSTASVAIGQDVATSASVTFAHVNADVSGDVLGDLTGNADTATTLETARVIELSGDVTGSVSFDGSTNVNIVTTVVSDGVELGVNTTGNYMVDVVAGTGVTVTHTPGEGSSASVAIGQDVATSASVTFAHVNADVTGDVIGDLTGNADTATTLQTARAISLAGDLSGSASFDGSQNITITAEVQPNSVALGTDTTGYYIASTDAVDGLHVRYIPFADVASYAGEYNNGASYANGDIVSTGVGSPYGTSGQLFIRVSNPGNPGYPPGTASWSAYSHQTSPSEGCLAVFAIDDTIMQVRVADVSNTEIGYLNGVTSAIQTQIDSKAPLDSPTFTGTVTLPDNTVALGSKTTGDYVSSLVAGTGITLSNNSGESATPTVAIGQDVATSASVTFAHVSAPLSGNVTGNLTGDVTGNADTASTLETARAISLSGDLSGSVSFDGSSNVVINATVEPNSVALGTDTTGNYMSDVHAGTGVSISHTPGEGSSASIAIGQAVGTSDNPSFAGVTADSVQIGISNATEIDTVSGNLTIDSAGGTTTLDDDVVITGTLTVSGSATYVNTEILTVDDNIIVLNNNQTGSPSQNAGIEVERGSSDNVSIRWNETNDSWELTEDGSTYRNIAAGQDVETSSSVSFAAVTAPVIGNASTATTLETARAISLGGDLSGSASFDGSVNITITADVQPNSVALGTDTTGNYLVDVVADSSGITVNHTAGEGSSASLSLVQDINTSASVTFANVTADLVGDVTGNADTATTLETARVISLGGDLSGSVSFDGSQNVTITAAVEPNSVALGTDTTGNFVNDVIAGTGVTVSHTPGEGSSASIAIGQDVATTASVTFAAVTAPLIGNASTASTLQTARTISLGGDLSGSASFDGSANVTITAQVEPNSVALGTDTTGNYVSDVVAGTAISVTHTPGEGSSASIALNAALDDLTDTVITSPEEFQTLEYNGTNWVNTYSPVVSYVRNAEATTLTTGTVVYLFGGNGDHASVKRADNSSDTTSSKTIGVVGASIAASQNGPIITRGYVDGMDLSAYSIGQVLWLGTGGQFTATKPSAPDHLVFVGVVVRATNNGIIYVATQNGYELEELHDVKVISAANGDFLKYNSASAVWVNDQINLGTDTVGDYVQNLVAGTGVTLTNNSGEGSTPTVAIGQDVATSASVVFHTIESTHDLTIGGNLYVSGSVITENQTSLAIDDPFIYLNVSSSVSNVDLGIAGNYNDGTYRHAGIFRDATDGKFKFFDSYEPEPSSPIDVAHATYSPAPVVAETFESTVTTGTAPFAVSSTTEVANLHADTATTLHTARAISLGGDLSGSASFDGSGDITITASVEPNSVALGTDTTGNYMVGLAEGTGVTITHTPGEGSTASVSIGQSVATTASVTFAHVSADLTGNVTGNISGNAGTASALQSARTISLGGDLSGSVSFNGTSDVTITASVEPNSVALGTDTTGNYMSDLTQGTGVTITHTPGEGSNATIAIGQAVGTSSSVTFAHVSAPITGNVTGDLTGNAGTATALQTSRTINLGGDLSGSASFNGTSDVTITATVQPNSVALGTDTTGNYMSGVTAGTGVTVTHTPGEGSSATIAIGQAVGTSDNPSFAGVTADGVQIGISASAEIDTTAGNLVIDSAGGTVTIDDNLIVSGDLTVNGTTTTVNTETINLADNLIVLNSNETGAPSQNAGIEVERGSSTNVALRWNEISDKWELTEDGSTYAEIATVTYVDAQTITSLDEIGDVSTASAASGDFLKWNGSAWVNDPINLGSDTVGNYVNDVTAGTGVTVTHTPGEGSSPTIAIGQAVGTSSSVTFAAVTAPLIGNVTGNADTATALATSRTIELTGDVTGSVSFNGSANASITATIAANSVALGTDTTGNYVSDVTGGTGVTVTHTPGEGSSPSIAIGQAVATSSSVQFEAVELGHASDTTLSRSAAGRLAVEGVNVPTISSTDTLTNKTLSSAVLTGTLTAGGGTGTSGQFLKTTGTGVEWAAAGAAVTTTTVSANTETTVATFTTASAKAAEFHVKVGQGDRLYSTKVIALHNGTTADFTKYGDLSLSAIEQSNPAGVTWTTRTSNFGNTNIRSVAFGNNLWVAGGIFGELRTSTDAITWVTRNSNFGGSSMVSVAYGNNIWVIGGVSGQIRSSTDAITWVTRTSNFGAYDIVWSITYGNNLWVAGGGSGTIRTSTDAITWVTRTSNVYSFESIYTVAYGNKYIAAGGNFSTRKMVSSTDGITWGTVAFFDSAGGGYSGEQIYSVSYGNNLWVAGTGGNGGAPVFTSTDAITWTTRTSNFGNTNIRSVAYGNNLWVAAGYYGQLRTSTDAITWTTRTSNFTNAPSGNIFSVAFGNNLWVAGGSYGGIRTSIAETASYYVGGLTSSASVTFNTDISGSNVRLRMTIPDAATTNATVKVLTTTVGES